MHSDSRHLADGVLFESCFHFFYSHSTYGSDVNYPDAQISLNQGRAQSKSNVVSSFCGSVSEISGDYAFLPLLFCQVNVLLRYGILMQSTSVSNSSL